MTDCERCNGTGYVNIEGVEGHCLWCPEEKEMDAHDEQDDALVDGLLNKARNKEWKPMSTKPEKIDMYPRPVDSFDIAARELAPRVVQKVHTYTDSSGCIPNYIRCEADIEALIAAALRRAAADGAKAEREACLTSLAELNVQHWSMATESEFYHGRAVSIDAAINHLRARAKGGA